jgi:hypothetical protein
VLWVALTACSFETTPSEAPSRSQGGEAEGEQTARPLEAVVVEVPEDTDTRQDTDVPVSRDTAMPPEPEHWMGLRARSFGNGGSRELFAGVPDLGVLDNRVELDLTWADGDNHVGLVRGESGWSVTVDNTAGSWRLPFTPPDACDFAAATRAKIRLSDADASGRVASATLASLGRRFAIVTGDGGYQEQEVPLARGEAGSLELTVVLAGPFSGSQEAARVELLVGCAPAR